MTSLHVVAAVIIYHGKILCAQRGPEKSLAYKWEFPGGKIEAGETPQEALKREIREEMRCEIDVGEQAGQTVHEYDFGMVELTLFYCKLTKGRPVLTEHAAINWLAPHEFMGLDWAPADIPVVQHIQIASRNLTEKRLID